MSECIESIIHSPQVISDTCRMCLKTSGNFISLDSSFESSADESTYWDAYNFCTNLRAESTDSLPTIICIECTDKLKIVFDIVRKAIHSDQVLRRTLEKIHEEEHYNEAEFEELDEKIEFLEFLDQEVQNDSEDNAVEEFVYLEEPYTQLEDDDTILKEYACDLCEEVFSDEKDLVQHIIVHDTKVESIPDHDESSQGQQLSFTNSDNNKDTKSTERVFMCEYCAKTFSSKQKLKMHTFVHTKEKNFPCHLCPKRFITIFKQREHLRNHAGIRNHVCQVCDRRFFSKNTLVCHMRTHTGDRPYKCKLCDKSFTQSSILKSHVSLHEGKMFPCPKCRKTFSRKSHMHLHMRCHTGERPYKCHLCSNTYKQKCHLDRHIDTHLGVRFTCEICQRQYTKKGSLKSHMYTHSKDRPYKCELCPKDFQSKDRYKRHMRNTHKRNRVSLDEFNSDGSLENEEYDVDDPNDSSEQINIC